MVTHCSAFQSCYWSWPRPHIVWPPHPIPIPSPPEEQAILRAVRAFDVEALRRCLAAGVDPDMLIQCQTSPLYVLRGVFRAGRVLRTIQARLACISVLLEAGASVDLRQGSGYGKHDAVVLGIGIIDPHHTKPSSQLLIESGADVNETDEPIGPWLCPVSKRSNCGTAATVKKLISAGAVDLDRALKSAIRYGKQRNCAPLLRAGAAIPARTTGEPRMGPVEGRTLADTLAYVENPRGGRLQSL